MWFDCFYFACIVSKIKVLKKNTHEKKHNNQKIQNNKVFLENPAVR